MRLQIFENEPNVFIYKALRMTSQTNMELSNFRDNQFRLQEEKKFYIEVRSE
jgi:hypothetical protein